MNKSSCYANAKNSILMERKQKKPSLSLKKNAKTNYFSCMSTTISSKIFFNFLFIL